ncbi:ras-related protein Rab-34 isoform X2 [Chiroxiphia lanceolata]|uniref:ras-related protein Rab-34 isoform X2 n=1 Tax=Chiroxiphia lanceolata TaxID=296741 RepID=UPI0013CEA9CA|nr:ras-related protein Rab-34 isoform X2 [Chiroxiphia lanceolata]
MNVLAPVRRDRVIADLPSCFRKEAALQTRPAFHPTVASACQEQRTGTVGFKISKIIVVGDLSVGKTCLINRFCKDTFDKNYKATIGVDFEMERFEVLGVPFSLQLWDTAGQERFKCIASTYYRGAQAIVIVFDVNDVASLEHTRQWLADALKENDPSNVILFLVGSKKDLSVSVSPSPWANCTLAQQGCPCHPLPPALLSDTSTVQPDGEGRSQGGPGDAGGVLGCLLAHWWVPGRVRGMQIPASSRVRGHSGGLILRGRGERAGFLLPCGGPDLREQRAGRAGAQPHPQDRRHRADQQQ